MDIKIQAVHFNADEKLKSFISEKLVLCLDNKTKENFHI